MRGDRAVDRLVGGEVDPERLLAEQVLAGCEAGDVELLVQVMRHSAVDRLDRVVCEQLPVVGIQSRPRFEALEPREGLGARVADGRDLRTHAEVGQVDPARGGARELAAHQTAADHAEAHMPVSHARSASACA